MSKNNFEANCACVVCHKLGPGLVTYHHLFTRKVYPEFQKEKWNQIPVCQGCHNKFHNKGTNYMAEKFLTVHLWLVRHEWFFCDYVKKWRRDGF